MGTKSNPGEFDCYAKAADDEPIFTLRSKDPLAPIFIRMWIAVRGGNVLELFSLLADLVQAGMQYSMTPDDPEKIMEAYDCADAMERYREDNFQ